MKKVLSLLLSALLLLSSLGVLTITAAATSAATVEFSSAEGEIGDTVTLTLNLKNNTGIAGLLVSLSYDTTVLSVTESQAGTLFSGYTAGKNYAWDESENVTENGVLATFTFKISDTAAVKDYAVGVIVRSCINDAYEDLEYNVIEGKISVKAKSIPVTGFALNATSATVETGDETLTLTPVFTPDTATNKQLTWVSSDNSIATVAEGVVTLIKKGVVTITATTQDGNYSASCVLTINCSHRSGEVIPAVASTCSKAGHGEYTLCVECGEIISGSATELPLAEHTGGTATCENKAVCSVCNQEYGELGAHALVKQDSVEPNHSNTGNTEYYTCSVCEKVFSDALGNSEITLSDTVLPIVPHSYPATWTTDDSGHWKECTCGNKADFEAHSYDNTCDTTCNTCGYARSITHSYSDVYSSDSAQHWYECSCGEKNAAANHSFTWITDKEATEKEKGLKHEECSVCGYKKTAVDIPVLEHTHSFGTQWKTDASQHWYECSCGEKNAAANHSFTWITDKEATEKEKGLKHEECSVCGYKKTAVDIPVLEHTHSFGTQWKTDAAQHWNECSCGEKNAAANHSFTWITDKEATEKEKGLKHEECSVCGYKKTAVDIPVLEHTHSFGTQWKTDAAQHWNECSCGEKNAVAAHSFTWITDKEATEKEKGLKHEECSVCGYKKTVVDIPVLEHTHSFGTQWKTDTAQHWNECSCGEKNAAANHSFTWITDKEATEKEKGLKHEECSVCGYKKTAVDIPVLGEHKHSFIAAIAGKSGIKKCTDCDMLSCSLGDVDGDGTLSAADARLALRQAVKLEALVGIGLAAANADGAAEITAADARLILRASVKLEDVSKWEIVIFKP